MPLLKRKGINISAFQIKCYCKRLPMIFCYKSHRVQSLITRPLLSNFIILFFENGMYKLGFLVRFLSLVKPFMPFLPEIVQPDRKVV